MRVTTDGERVRNMLRWDIPSPKQVGERPVINVRTVQNPHWRPWAEVRGTEAENPDRIAEEHRLFSFLTCEGNDMVGPVRPKAMPVLLTSSRIGAHG